MNAPKSDLQICYGCTRYQLDCDGRKHFKLGDRRNGKPIKTCNNQTRGDGNTGNLIQVNAFKSLFRIKVRCGTEKYMAFAEAIVQSADDVFDQIPDDVLANYYEMIGAKSAKN